MANVENNNRIAGFVKKHVFAKRWVSIMLVIALLVTTVTMYALNKSATAVSEESAESVGMVLDTASTEGEDGATSEDVVVEETQEETSENETSESETVEATTEETTEEVTEETTNTETESTAAESSESTESNESNEGDSESTTVAETENTSEESDTENTEEEAPASQAENTEETENTENTESTENTENPESDNSSEEVTTEEDTETDETLLTEETEEVKEETGELTQEVVLTVSYKDENGENIADDKVINLENSIDFTEAAPKQEGYIFKDARLDDAVITKITVEYDVNMFKYYVVTREDGSTEEVKEDKTVVLTYTKEEIVKSEIKLTAKFADKNGESIKEDAELKLTSELDVTKKENVDAIDNYFYMGATYNGEKIAKITPVAATETEEATTEETENTESNTVSSYVITTKDGAEVSVTEDAEIVFTYYAAITQTEFKVTNDKVTVTATLSAAGAFPEGIELNVTEVNAQTQGYNYDAYMQALNDNADKVAEAKGDEESNTYNGDNTLLYDIAFVLDGIEYQPAEGTVSISIELNEKQLSEGNNITNPDDVTLFHLPIDEKVMSNIESTEKATDISAEDIEVEVVSNVTVELDSENDSDVVSFDTESFSLYGFSFTTNKYSWVGDGLEDNTPQWIVNELGDAAYFGVVADQFTAVGDFESNVAVNTINFEGNSNTEVLFHYGNVIKESEFTQYKIKVTKKSTTPGEFTFGLFKDKNGTQRIGDYFTIKTDNKVNGYYVGEYTLDGIFNEQNLVNSSLFVYEVDSKNVIIGDGNTVDGYTVTYESSSVNSNDSLSALMGNYVRDWLNNHNANENKGGDIDKYLNKKSTLYYLESGQSDTYKRAYKESSENIKIETVDGKYPVNVDSMRAKVAEVSSQLACAASVPGVIKVINIVANGDFGMDAYNAHNDAETDQNNKWTDSNNDVVNKGFAINQNEFLVINLDLTKFKDSTYKVDKNYTIKVGNTSIQASTQFNDLSSKVIFNLVQRDDDGKFVPFSGNIEFTYEIGTVLAPNATVKSEHLDGGIIAKNYRSDGGEIHKIPLLRYKKYQGEVTVINTQNEKKPVEVELFKTLDGHEPGEAKFGFVIQRMKDDFTGWIDSNSRDNEISNDNKSIKYTISPDDWGMDINTYKTYYFKVYEKEIDDNSYKTDKSIIFIKIDYSQNNEKPDISYYKLPEIDSKFAMWINNLNNWETKKDSNSFRVFLNNFCSDNLRKVSGENVKFENETHKVGDLKIHKMVVNDFSSGVVRDDANSILRNVKFRITNNETHRYIVFKGFVGSAGLKGTAFEFGADKKATGVTYEVTYNESAQWTVKGIPAGIYTVEEVADGYTLEYKEADNEAVAIENAELYRVTEYDVTTDREGAPKKNEKDYGGDNYRAVFAGDIKKHSEKAPDDVRVGDSTVSNASHTQTVQICNYYSKPIGPIKVTKNLTGGKWTEDSNNWTFKFKMEAVSADAHLSDGTPKALASIPMPEGSNGGVKEVIVDGKDLTNDGPYTKTVEFGSIPFKYEGTYIYKIYEDATYNTYENIKYDQKVYYVRFVVTKNTTDFYKKYTKKKCANPDGIIYPHTEKDGYLIKEKERFVYIGAQIEYYDQDITNLSAEQLPEPIVRCEQFLVKPTTNIETDNSVLEFRYLDNKSEKDLAFTNKVVDRLVIRKEWTKNGDPDNESDHSGITVVLHHVTAEGDSQQTFNITDQNREYNDQPWTKVIEIERVDNSSYYIEETNGGGLIVTYSNDPDGKNQNTDPTAVKVQADGTAGKVITFTIRNELGGNTLPSTGGTGTMPFAVGGLGIATLGLLGFEMSRKRKRED